MLTGWQLAPPMCCKPGQPELKALMPEGLQRCRLAIRTFDVLHTRAAGAQDRITKAFNADQQVKPTFAVL